MAAEMGTDGRKLVKLAFAIPKCRNFLQSRTDDHALATFYFANRLAFSARQSVFEHVVGVILIFFYVVPRSALDLLSVKRK